MDMSTLFKSIVSVCFPKAEIVADKFHVQRLVNWAFEDIRKDVQKYFAKQRRIYFKHSKTLLLKNMDELTEKQFEQVSHMLELSDRLAKAYYLMQEFRKVLNSDTVEEAKLNLSNWYMHVGVTDENDFKRFHACVYTFTTWQHEILNAFSTGLSNGYTEGCNNRIKVIKRAAYGFRNFKRFRKRILHIMTA